MYAFLFIISLSTFSFPVSSVEQYPFVFACERDNSCPSGYKKVYCGYSGFTFSQCAPSDKACETNFVVSLNITTCEKSDYGQVCPSKVCQKVTDSTLCTDSLVKNLKCFDGRKLEGKCKDCPDCTSGKCLDYDNGAATICYPLSRCYAEVFHADFFYCPEAQKTELSGCECCSDQDKITDIKTQCYEGSDFLTSQFLTHYNGIKNSFRRKISSTCEKYQANFPSFQLKTVTSFVTLLLSIALIISA